MTTEQVLPLFDSRQLAPDQTVPPQTLALIDRIDPARTSEVLATFATGGSRCETRKKL
jgi:hypothetical protein